MPGPICQDIGRMVIYMSQTTILVDIRSFGSPMFFVECEPYIGVCREAICVHTNMSPNSNALRACQHRCVRVHCPNCTVFMTIYIQGKYRTLHHATATRQPIVLRVNVTIMNKGPCGIYNKCIIHGRVGCICMSIFG